MSYDIMYDMETMGTHPTAPMVSFGYVKFNPYQLDKYEDILATGMYYIVNYSVEEIKKFDLQFETVKWWVKQKAEVSEAIFGPGTPVKLMLLELNTVFSVADHLWSQGWMDPAILANTYFQMDMELGFHFRKPTCSRTASKFADNNWPAKPKGFIGHNALHDAAYQAYSLQRLINE
jgi:hypothetical protein